MILFPFCWVQQVLPCLLDSYFHPFAYEQKAVVETEKYWFRVMSSNYHSGVLVINE